MTSSPKRDSATGSRYCGKTQSTAGSSAAVVPITAASMPSIGAIVPMRPCRCRLNSRVDHTRAATIRSMTSTSSASSMGGVFHAPAVLEPLHAAPDRGSGP